MSRRAKALRTAARAASLLVAASAPLAQQPATPGAAVDAAVAAGTDHLLACQEVDGSWRYRGGPHLGKTALNLYALLKSGVPRSHHAVQRSIVWLEQQPLVATYDTSLVLMVLAEHDPVGHRRWITDAQRALLDWQDVGFGYGLTNGDDEGRGDLSNTQYAALGLHAAETAGVEAPYRAWRDLAEFALECRHASGGFTYRPDGDNPTGSMTAAGVAIAILAMEHLDAKGRLGSGLEKDLVEARDAGIEWLGANFSVTSNPGGGWHHYYLYGLERVGAFADLVHFAGNEWYAKGAAFLTGAQRGTGGWGAGYSPNDSDTAFALLFLTRASAPVTGVEGRHRNKVYGTPGDQGEVILVAAGDVPLELWVNGFPDAARERWEFDGEDGRGPRVVRAEFLADGKVIATVEGDGTLPAAEQRFATSHRFDEPGLHTVQVRVLVRDPDPAPGKATAWLASPELQVPVEEILPDWERDAALDAGRNLLAEQELEVQVSSTFRGSPRGLGQRHGEGFDGGHLVDGVQSRSWLCAEGDEDPWFRLDLDRRVFADRVVLSHARTLPMKPGALARALEVEVVIDAKHTVRALMNPDLARKTVVDLDGMRRVRGLEVRVLSSVAGTSTRSALGFAEVELQLSDDR